MMPQHPAYFFTYDNFIRNLPITCAATDKEGHRCPMLSTYSSDRVLGSVYIDDQLTLRDLTLDAGARFEVAGGKRGYDPTVLFSGAAVYRLLPGWYVKINYAEGFRPPTLQQTDGAGTSIQWTGNPNLEIERSRAVLGQTTLDVLRDAGRVGLLSLRANYSYTWVTNFINVVNGLYTNSADIGISAVEFTALLRMKNDAWFSLGYTFQDIADAGRGAFRSLPAQWLSASMFVPLIREYLGLSSNLIVMGSSEDPNKYPLLESTPLSIGRVEVGPDGKLRPLKEKITMARGSDILFDRVPPSAIWNIGLQSLLFKKRLSIRVDVYNVLDSRHYYPDAFFDMSTGLETQPNPINPIAAYATVGYHY